MALLEIKLHYFIDLLQINGNIYILTVLYVSVICLMMDRLDRLIPHMVLVFNPWLGQRLKPKRRLKLT